MGYNLKRYGWLNNFTDVKNQSMQGDGCLGEVLVKSVPSSSPSFCLPSRTRTTLPWIGNVALVRSSLPCLSGSCFLCLSFFYCGFISNSFPYPHLYAFCYSEGFHNCMPLHSTPYCGAWLGYWCLQVHPPPHTWVWARIHLSTGRPSTWLSLCSSSSKDGEAQFRFPVCVSLFLQSNFVAFLSSLIKV